MADLLLVFLRAMYVSNPAFKWTFMSKFPDWLCGLLGAILVFSAICTATWNFVIVTFILIPMGRGKPMYEIAEKRIWHIIFSWAIWIIVVIVPFLTPHGGSYGLTENFADFGLSKYQCFFVNKNEAWCLYGPIICYFLYCIIILLYMVPIFKKDNSIKQLTSRLIWYSVVFVFVWSGSVLDHMYRQFAGHLSVILVWYNWICIHCIGWTNAAVWYSYMKPNADRVKHLRYESIDMINIADSLNQNM
eukprot:537616_1